MAHFQERRAGGDRRQHKGEERRNNLERRGVTSENLETIERARFKAWMGMTDKSVED